MIIQKNQEDTPSYNKTSLSFYTPSLGSHIDSEPAASQMGSAEVSSQAMCPRDVVQISHEARQRFHAQRKEGTAMISNNTAISHSGVAEGSATAKKQAGEPAEAFEQYLDGTAAQSAPADSASAEQQPRGTSNYWEPYKIRRQQRDALPPEQRTMEDAFAHFGCSPLLGLPASLMLVPGNDAAKYEFYGLMKQCHDEVVDEMNIDLSKYVDNFELTAEQESKEAHLAMWAKLDKIPRAKELMDILGYTAKTDWGIPYNPNSICQGPPDDSPATASHGSMAGAPVASGKQAATKNAASASPYEAFKKEAAPIRQDLKAQIAQLRQNALLAYLQQYRDSAQKIHPA